MCNAYSSHIYIIMESVCVVRVHVRVLLFFLRVPELVGGLYLVIGILPAYTRYRLVGKVHPPLVSNVEQVARAEQLHLRKGRL